MRNTQIEQLLPTKRRENLCAELVLPVGEELECAMRSKGATLTGLVESSDEIGESRVGGGVARAVTMEEVRLEERAVGRERGRCEIGGMADGAPGGKVAQRVKERAGLRLERIRVLVRRVARRDGKCLCAGRGRSCEPDAGGPVLAGVGTSVTIATLGREGEAAERKDEERGEGPDCERAPVALGGRTGVRRGRAREQGRLVFAAH